MVSGGRRCVIAPTIVCSRAWLAMTVVRPHMRLEVVFLRKALATARERANVGALPGVGAHVRAQIEVEREALAAALKRTEVRSLARVGERMTLQL